MKIGDSVNIYNYYSSPIRDLNAYVYSINYKKGAFKVAPNKDSSWGDSFYTEYKISDFEYIPTKFFVFGGYWTDMNAKTRAEEKEYDLRVKNRMEKLKKEGWEF